jgi:hypothetical protein
VRNKSLEDKKREVLQKTLEGFEQSREMMGLRYDPETNLPYGFPMEEVIGLFDYFEDKPLYTMDLPVANIPHPEPRRRLVDPELEGTPSHLPVTTRHDLINSFYQLTEHFDRLIEEGFEIFIYLLTPAPMTYDPVNFVPQHRWGIRYAVIHMDRWTNIHAEYREPMSMEMRFPQPNPLTPEQSYENKDIVISKSRTKYKHKFT